MAKKQTKKERIEERTEQLMKMASPWQSGDVKGVNLRHGFRKSTFCQFVEGMSDADIDVECEAIKATLTVYRDLAAMDEEERAAICKDAGLPDFKKF